MTLQSMIRCSLFLAVLALGSGAHAATLSMTAKYGLTGGVKGDLNQTTDQVNGRSICPTANDYSNGTPGCDMSSDAGYNDQGTSDTSDDTYDGDLIVRTNDVFQVIAGYNWTRDNNETPADAPDTITIKGTLPAGKGFVWDELPGGCKLPESSISPDGKSIVCVRDGVDKNSVGSYSEDFALPVRVESDASNGATPGDITLTAEAQGAPSVTDNVAKRSTDLIKVTASPRWNLEKSGYTVVYNVTDPDNAAKKGSVVIYKFYIEADEITGAADTGVNPALGNEMLTGGESATITFTDDLSGISSNAKLFQGTSVYGDSNRYLAGSPCSTFHYTSSSDPYPYNNGVAAERSIPRAKGDMPITCTQTGSSVAMEISNITTKISDLPEYAASGAQLPVNRKIAAIATLRVFVPNDDIINEGSSFSGYNQKSTSNVARDFAPEGISGTQNFNGAQENEVDNNQDYTLRVYTTGVVGAYKYYRKGWSDLSSERAQWGGGTWSDLPPNSVSYYTGEGLISPGQIWGSGTAMYSSSASAQPITDAEVCDVIDASVMEYVAMDNPGPYVTNNLRPNGTETHAVDLNYSSTELSEPVLFYGTGYVGSWPPDPDDAADSSAKMRAECDDPGTWYPSLDAAIASNTGPVTKIRVKATKPLQPGWYLYPRIKHRALNTYAINNALGGVAGQPIPSGTLLVNRSAYKHSNANIYGSSFPPNQWNNNSYRPRTYDTSHIGYAYSDRIALTRALARIQKTVAPTNVETSDEVTVTLRPTVTSETQSPAATSAKIIDVMPKGLVYQSGSTTGTYASGASNYPEPTSYPATDANCNTHAKTVVDAGKPCGTLNGGTGQETILVWELPSVTPNDTMSPLVFQSVVGVEMPSGSVANYAAIESPDDFSGASKRFANANLTHTIPAALLINKQVLTPTNDINLGSLSAWMKFRVGLKNGASNTLTNLDVIDLIPFNGDGADGSFTFTPSSTNTVLRKRVPPTNYQGTFQFKEAMFDNNGVCTGTPEYWYSNTPSTVANPLDISPKHPSNAIPGGSTTWCAGDSTGPAGSCGFTASDVTAIRVRGPSVPKDAVCYLNTTFETQDNYDKNQYSNTASASGVGVTNAVLSNTVMARVETSSISGTVFVDDAQDTTADSNLANICITVTNGTQTYSMRTDANGAYDFSAGKNVFPTADCSGTQEVLPGLIAGNYTVSRQSTISGYIDGSDYPGTIDGTATGSANATNTVISSINLGFNKDSINNNFSMITVDPKWTLEKSITGGNPYSASGNSINYSYVITNTGNVPISNISVTDDKITAPNSVSCPATILAVDASMTCTATYSATQPDVDAGSVTNNATASGTPADGALANATDNATATATQTPNWTFAKSITSGDAYSAEGDVVNYSYVITNTGNISISNVGVTDDKIASVACPATPNPLLPTQSITCTASYTVTQADIDAGSVTNTASPTGTPAAGALPSLSDQATATATQNPLWEMAKSITAGNPYDAVGGTISYSYVLTNNGNVTINSISVSDDKIVAPNTVSCPSNTLAPSASLTCTATYTVTQADIDAGLVTNVATASGTPTGGTLSDVTDEQTANANANPEFDIEKTLVGLDNDVNGNGLNNVGDALRYRVTATNVGNLTLTNMVVSDPMLTPNSKTCVSLAPQATCVLEGTYVIDVDDLTTESQVRNTGKAQADQPPEPETATLDTPVQRQIIATDDDYRASPVNGKDGNPSVANNLGNDTVNQFNADVSKVNIAVLTPATGIGGSSIVPVLDPATGNISVPANTPAGDYQIEYQICDVNDATNCDTATIYLTVTAATITADLDDFTSTPVLGSTGNSNLGNAFDGDTLNGNPVNPSDITATIQTPATPQTPGAPVPAMDPNSGQISVPPNTPAGDYEITYQICETINPSNCATNKVLVRVDAGAIATDLDDFTASPVAGATGNDNVGNAFDGDTLNGSPVNAADINAEVLTPANPKEPGAPVPMMDPNTGQISVPANTPAGDYEIEYRICEKLNPSNCSTNKVLVRVAAGSISTDLDDFTVNSVSSTTGNPNLGNAFDGDMLNGSPVDVADINAEVLTPATPKEPGASVPVMDPATGQISVPPNTPAGDYEIEYRICEKLNPSNCSTNKVLVRVSGSITADLDDFTDIVVRSNKGRTNLGNAFDGDTLNGQPVVVSDITARVVTPATPRTSGAPVPVLDPATGQIDVPPGTPEGDYEIEYEICEKASPSNCVTNKVLVRVSGSLIEQVPVNDKWMLWLLIMLFGMMGYAANRQHSSRW